MELLHLLQVPHPLGSSANWFSIQIRLAIDVPTSIKDDTSVSKLMTIIILF